MAIYPFAMENGALSAQKVTTEFNRKLINDYFDGKINYNEIDNLSSYKIYYKSRILSSKFNYIPRYYCSLGYEIKKRIIDQLVSCRHVDLLINSIRIGNWKILFYPINKINETGKSDLTYIFTYDLSDARYVLDKFSQPDSQLFTIEDRCILYREIDGNYIDLSIIVISVESSVEEMKSCILNGFKFSVGFFRSPKEIDPTKRDFDFLDFFAIYHYYSENGILGTNSAVIGDYNRFREIIDGN